MLYYAILNQNKLIIIIVIFPSLNLIKYYSGLDDR